MLQSIIAALFTTVLSAAARFLENIPGLAPLSVAARPRSKLDTNTTHLKDIYNSQIGKNVSTPSTTSSAREDYSEDSGPGISQLKNASAVFLVLHYAWPGVQGPFGGTRNRDSKSEWHPAKAP